MAATKINLTKLARTSNINAVRGRSYEIFFTRKFTIRKFLYTKISRSTAYNMNTYVYYMCLNICFISLHFRTLPIFLKIVQKLHKEHLSTTPAPDVQTAPLISDLLQLGLDMCKTRMSMMPQESRKAFINIMTNLIEKSSDAKLLRVITKIVEEWVKSKVHTYTYYRLYK